LRQLAQHVVRLVRLDAVDRAQLAALGEIARCVPIVRALCPEGAAFVPWMAGVLAEAARPSPDGATKDRRATEAA
jgi:hypothetical protein